MKSLTKKLLFLALPLLFYGCATQEVFDLVWPEPPEQPRIKYVRDYVGSADFKQGSTAADILLGAEGGGALRKPQGIHVDQKGRIYVTDTANSDVFVWDPANKNATSLGAMGAKIFQKPIAVTTDDQDRIYVSDSQLDKVSILDQQGKFISYLNPETPLKQPTGIAFDKKHKRLYVIDTHNHNIAVFDTTTLKQIKTIGKRGKEEGEFNFPSNIAVDNRGFVYVVDTMNGRVQIFDDEGKFVRAFGQFGDAPGMFARPKGISIDSEGHVYVVDSAFNVVQIFNDEGQILLFFSGYGSEKGQMILPTGISVDKDDFIYVVDSWNRRVEVYEYLGDKSKARGTVLKLKK